MTARCIITDLRSHSDLEKIQIYSSSYGFLIEERRRYQILDSENVVEFKSGLSYGAWFIVVVEMASSIYFKKTVYLGAWSKNRWSLSEIILEKNVLDTCKDWNCPGCAKTNSLNMPICQHCYYNWHRCWLDWAAFVPPFNVALSVVTEGHALGRRNDPYLHLEGALNIALAAADFAVFGFAAAAIARASVTAVRIGYRLTPRLVYSVVAQDSSYLVTSAVRTAMNTAGTVAKASTKVHRHVGPANHQAISVRCQYCEMVVDRLSRPHGKRDQLDHLSQPIEACRKFSEPAFKGEKYIQYVSKTIFDEDDDDVPVQYCRRKASTHFYCESCFASLYLCEDIYGLVIGFKGVGKSTLVNKMVGRQVATVGDDLTDGTTELAEYEVDSGYHVIDSVGLNRHTLSNNVSEMAKFNKFARRNIQLLVIVLGKETRITADLQRGLDALGQLGNSYEPKKCVLMYRCNKDLALQAVRHMKLNVTPTLVTESAEVKNHLLSVERRRIY
jgi:hypothetical protein